MPLAGFQSVHIPGNDFHILRPYLSSLQCIHLYKGVMFHCIMKRKRLQSGGGFGLAERERRWGEKVLALPDIDREWTPELTLEGGQLSPVLQAGHSFCVGASAHIFRLSWHAKRKQDDSNAVPFRRISFAQNM